MRAKVDRSILDNSARKHSLTVSGKAGAAAIILEEPTGEMLRIKSVTVEKTTVSGGATETITAMIPDGAIILGASARVLTILAGAALTTWSLGITGATTLFGTALALAVGTTVKSSNHLATALQLVAADTNVLLTAAAGVFSSGKVRVTIFFIDTTAPTA